MKQHSVAQNEIVCTLKYIEVLIDFNCCYIYIYMYINERVLVFGIQVLLHSA